MKGPQIEKVQRTSELGASLAEEHNARRAKINQNTNAREHNGVEKNRQANDDIMGREANGEHCAMGM